MKVPAGEAGQLLSLGNGQQELQLGQWVLAGQTLATVAQPGKLKAVRRVPETQAKDVSLGQKVDIDTRAGGGGGNSGIVKGHVSRVDPAAINGTVTVEVLFDEEAPKGARSDLSVDGVIEIERLDNVLFVQRPAYGQAESTVGLFKLDPGGKTASRVNVKLGRSSVSTIEIVSGLQPKDKVIVSDMSHRDNVARFDRSEPLPRAKPRGRRRGNGLNGIRPHDPSPTSPWLWPLSPQRRPRPSARCPALPAKR
jgi:multidrug efflux pump subunit AcrA (membrane-fusion protein)